MRKLLGMFLTGALVLGTLTGCGDIAYTQIGNGVSKENSAPKILENVTEILLSDEKITVDGAEISTDESAAVYAARDIVFYLAGQGFTYGEGQDADEHTQEEADKHTVVHITKPGTYAVTGTLSAGQIAVDLGEDAEDDPNAVVTLILNQADITCTVAPGVIFYNVYECSAADKDNPTKDVDTSAAGANVIIADGTYNVVRGSYVARIYKSYTLSEDGTEVVDNKKLHKYDGAFYSKMSMNVNGDTTGTGVLEIYAENEGLDSELHLTINGGNIKIEAGNDGINTNEDGVSVTTINGGAVVLGVNGSTGEGDGIDSNGWLVINGGTVVAYACGSSGDGGIDSDMGIHINGGNVIATGNMMDRIGDSEQNFAVFSFASRQKGGEDVVLKNAKGEAVGKWATLNNYSYLIVAGDFLTEGTYSLWIGDKQYQGAAGGSTGGFGGGMGFAGGQRPELPEGMEMPEGGFDFGDGERPEGMEMPEGGFSFENGERPELPEGMELPEGGFNFEDGERPERHNGELGDRGQGDRGQNDRGNTQDMELSKEFVVAEGGNYYNGVSVAEE